MKLKKYEYKIGDLTKVLVNNRRCIGEIMNLENNIATVKVKTYYREDEMLVKQHINDLWRVVKDINDFKN